MQQWGLAHLGYSADTLHGELTSPIGAPGAGGADHQDSKPLRIASIVLILLAGLGGALPPLWLKVFQMSGHPLPRIVRALTAGIILSLALVHIIPDSLADLDQLSDSMSPDYPYNMGGVCVVVGVLLMLILESTSHAYMERRAATQAVTLSLMDPLLDDSETESLSDSHAVGTYMPPNPHLHTHPHSHSMKCEEASLRKHSQAIQAEDLIGVLSGAVVGAGADPHTHVCMRNTHLALAGIPSSNIQEQVVAIMFEIGCIFHSFIIGLTLGVDQGDIATVRALLIALSFHQFLEGVALGSFITQAFLPRWKSISMVVVYSLTCPAGIAIGLGVADSYNASSVTALAVQGVLNGVSGGLLLYIALVQLIAEDFSRREVEPSPIPATAPESADPDAHAHAHAHAHDDRNGASSSNLLVSHAVPRPDAHAHGHKHSHGGGPPETWVLIACYAALAAGAGCMAVIAIWM